VIDERGLAGAEHLDPSYVAGYDRKAGVEACDDVELLQRLGLDGDSTVVDLGAGTGLFAQAVAPLARRVVAVDPSPAMLERARDRGLECVEAGFLTYEHAGDAADFVYSRNALHHLPDFWKAVALLRVAQILAPGGVLVLRDLVYSFGPAETDDVLEAWYATAATDAADGWTRAELETHVATEYSTFSWLLEPMLERAGLRIDEAWYAESRMYARYVCRRRASS
jgi:SAM-dependent methyltransferase